MKKKLAMILASVMGICMLSGCGNAASKEEAKSVEEIKEIQFTVPDGLPAIAAAKMIKEKPEIDKDHNISYSIEQSSDTLSTSVMKGEPDIAIVPSNLAAIVYNKNKEYKIAGTVGWGSFYIGSSDDQVTSLENLKDREVYSISKGLTPDIIARAVLTDKGIDVDKDINFSYVDGVTELAPVILSGKAQYAVIPEPALSNVQVKNENFKTIMNLNDEWKSLNNSEYGYPQSTIIVKSDLIYDDKEFVTKVLDKVNESCSWIYDNKEELGSYCEEIGVSAKKDIIVKAVDRSNINYAGIKDCYNEYKIYFDKLNQFEAKTIGGSIPDDEIFMEK
ncbi:ABC transporter substrate-binding protein [uncultured Clostridium sp.]|uniref:ABC transporter substrate-binding protein n=1 Tax=uncultured Clostridium sp. TaxID=59620 RepID=UPI0025E23EC9|nr:PhnD/SsuA/transferrin family substrate-binding protein [uncultured Clostridium sp.]